MPHQVPDIKKTLADLIEVIFIIGEFFGDDFVLFHLSELGGDGLADNTGFLTNLAHAYCIPGKGNCLYDFLLLGGEVVHTVLVQGRDPIKYRLQIRKGTPLFLVDKNLKQQYHRSNHAARQSAQGFDSAHLGVDDFFDLL